MPVESMSYTEFPRYLNCKKQTELGAVIKTVMTTLKYETSSGIVIHKKLHRIKKKESKMSTCHDL